MNKKSLATIQIIDIFGSPISKTQYEVRNQKTGQVIAVGSTNSAGCIVEISRDKDTVIDVYIKSMFGGLMVKVQSFLMSKDRMLVKITSPKVLLDLKTLEHQGSGGQYKRKTHTRSLAKVNLRASNSAFLQLNSFLNQIVSVYSYSVLLISENA